MQIGVNLKSKTWKSGNIKLSTYTIFDRFCNFLWCIWLVEIWRLFLYYIFFRFGVFNEPLHSSHSCRLQLEQPITYQFLPTPSIYLCFDFHQFPLLCTPILLPSSQYNPHFFFYQICITLFLFFLCLLANLCDTELLRFMILFYNLFNEFNFSLHLV